MKKQTVIVGGLSLSALLILLLIQRNHQMNQNGNRSSSNSESPAGNSATGQVSAESDASNGKSAGRQAEGSASSPQGDYSAPKAVVTPKENDCFRFTYQHESKNQNRDIEDFLNDTNAFPVAHANVNPKSICVKVNDKPVNHQFSKKGSKTEVLIGSVVGPESTIQVSYCVGKATCREACAVKTKNKVDELLSDHEMGGLENAELETQVKELRNVASVHGDLMDSAVIRDWIRLQSKEWVCEK